MNITMRIKTTMSIGLLTLNGFIQSGEAVPVQVPYSGQLAENGSLVNGAKSMTFHITDGGSSVYYDSGLLAVQVANGAFSVVLGGTGTSTLDSSVFDGTPRFLRVTVEGIVLSPLQPVHFTPHSVHAITSGSASNASIAASVAANSITGASIADGSVPPTKLNTTGASADQFLGYDGAAAQWAFLTLNAGPGLSGGGSDWPQSLSVSFGGDGLASTVARSDHNHITNTVNREYVVQYRESDFSFASRLLEEEGIYYFFQHDSTGNKIILADGRAGTNHAGPDFEFRAGDGAGLNQTGGDILLRPGRSTGTGSPGRVAIVGPTAADLNLDGLTDTIFAIRSRSDSPVHDGPALVLQGGDAAGANKSGGAVVLRPGTNSTSGTAPLKIETELVQLILHSANPLPADLQVQRGGNAPGVLRYGTNDLWQISNAGGPFRSVATLDSDGLLDAAKLGGVSASSFARLDGSSQLFTGSNAFLGPVSFFGPGSQPFFVGNNSNRVANLNADLLDGISSEVFARLDLSNRFNAPITFTKPVEHETNAYFKIKFNDLLVSSFSISGQGHGDPIPTESISFNFGTITHAYTNELTNGASLKFVAGDAIAAGATGGDIRFKPGSGGGGGRDGIIALLAHHTEFHPDGKPVRAVINVSGSSNTITLSATNTNPDHDGPGVVLQGGDAAGLNHNGGSVVLRPGTNSSGTTAPMVIQTELVQMSLTSVEPIPADIQVQRSGNAPGVLRYGTNDLWQISNAGGPFRSVATLDSDGLLDAAKLGGFNASSFARLDGSSQLFTGSNAFLGPVSFFGPGSQPFFVGTNANVVQNLNCDLLDGVSSEMFARLDLSNRFNAPVTFTKPVEHETNAYFKIKFNDLLVSSFSISGQGHGDPIPTESISFNFDTITHAHTNGLTNGASLRFKAGDAMAAGASGGDIELRPGVGAPGGRSGTLNLGSDTIKLGDALAGQDVILVVDQNPGQPHIRYDWAEDLWKFATAGGAIIPLDGNADTFDGLDSTAFARLSQDNLWSGAQTFNGGIAANAVSTSTPLQGAAAKPGVAVNTAAPSVTNLTMLQLVNYIAPTEITELSGGVDGQVIVLVGGNNPAPVVVRDGGGQFNLTADWQAMPDHTLTLCRANGRWLETSRAAN
jgi:type VI protein secretion system component Hcp